MLLAVLFLKIPDLVCSQLPMNLENLILQNKITAFMTKKLLLLFMPLKTWHQYIEGRKCFVETDHAALKYILTQGQIHNARQARWMKILQPFDLELAYKPGKHNPSDPLSRRPDLMCSTISSISSDLTRRFQQTYSHRSFLFRHNLNQRHHLCISNSILDA